jgi:hypothetical protein
VLVTGLKAHDLPAEFLHSEPGHLGAKFSSTAGSFAKRSFDKLRYQAELGNERWHPKLPAARQQLPTDY